MFLVGIAPTSLMTFINTWVPIAGKPSPVTALSASVFFPSLVALKNALGSLMFPTPTVPLITTAFRCFEAITVPTPDRPAALWRSLTIEAYRQPLSAALPTQAILTKGSWNFS